MERPANKPLKCGKCPAVFYSLERFIEHTKRKIHADTLSPLNDMKKVLVPMPPVGPLKNDNASSGPPPSVYENDALGKKLLRCGWCQRAFLSQSNLETHIRTHTGYKPFHCPECDYTCAQSGNLTKHVQAKHSVKVEAKYHYKIDRTQEDEKEVVEKRYKCDECTKSFGKRAHLMVHQRIHSGEQPFKCCMCGLAFSLSGNLNKHLKNIHGLPSIPQLGRFMQQIEDAKSMDEEPHVVAVNNGGSRSVLAQKYVVVDTPSGQQKSVVVDSPKSPPKYMVVNSLSNQPVATVDLIRATSSAERIENQMNRCEPIDCDKCKTTFMNKAQFQRHFLIHDQTTKPKKCPDCDYSNSHQSNVIRHFLGHSVVKPYKCGLCPLSFASKYRLTRHLKTHDKYTPEEKQQLQKMFGTDNLQGPCYVVPTRTKPAPIKIEPIENFKGDDDDDTQDTFPYTDGGSEDNNVMMNDGASEAMDDEVQNSSPEKSASPDKSCSPEEKSEQHFKTSFAFMKNLLQSEEEKKKELKRLEAQQRKEEKIKEDAAKKPFKCGLCERAFADKETLMAHVVRHTGQNKPYQCTYCLKRFGNQSSLRDHLPKHTGERNYECDICKKRFGHKGSLATHKLTHEEKEDLECNICDKTFTRKKYLRIHMLRHSGERPFKCDQCPKGFATSSALTLHKRTHSGEKPYKCDQCDKTFANSAYLTRHRIRHLSGKPNHTCDECGKPFALRSNLFVHKRTHRGLKPYECEYCSKNFSHSQAMVQHMRTHSVDMTYECEYCDKVYAQQVTLDRHMLIHSGDRTYSCDECNRAYTCESGLKQHMKHKHNDDMMLQCDYCDKLFGNKASLTIHKRIHTGEKPFQCSLCDKAYAQSGNLNKHLKSHGSMSIQAEEKPPRKRSTKKQAAGKAVSPAKHSAPRVVVIQQPETHSVLSRKFVISNR